MLDSPSLPRLLQSVHPALQNGIAVCIPRVLPAVIPLRQRGHDGDEQLAFGVRRVDVFLLEIDHHAFLLQLPNRGETVHCFSRKPVHRLSDDKVNLPVRRILYHLVESAPVTCVSRTYTLIRIHIYKFLIPAGI